MTGMNPAMLFKIKGMWDTFTKNHPKFPAFMAAVKAKGVPTDSILEISVTYPNGEKLATNIKVNNSDREMMSELFGMQQ